MTPRPLRGAFTATEEPLAVYWEGERIKLRPMGVRILIKLASAEYVTRGELMGKIKAGGTLRVHLVAVRRALPPGVTIETEHGQGYKLHLPHGAGF